jgi:hypothetical protein
MRSALTDTPVASFTTLLIKAAQHATCLMVKVAPLLPSRDLLSSQRQLRWTHTLVFAKAGRTEAVFQLFVFQFGFCSGKTLIIWLCANHQLLFINLASGSRAAEVYFPAFANT